MRFANVMMLMKRILQIGLILALTGTVQAQIVKVDRADVVADSSYWSGSIDFKLDVNNQSAEVDEDITYVGTTFKADLNYIGKKHLYMLVNRLQYFSTGIGPFVSTGYGHFRINWLRKKSLSYENFVQVQYDQGRNMEWRGLTGGGIKVRLFQAEKSYTHFGLGGMFEQERWKDFEGNSIEKNLWKMTSYLGADMKIGNSGELSTTFYYQVGHDLEDSVFRSRVSGELELQFHITKVLGFKTDFNLQYEDKPIIEIRNVVYSITNGITLNF